MHVGTISMGAGSPLHADQWSWRCGFYPRSRPGECSAGTATTFDAAREAFEAAWRIFLSKRTDADFQDWREHQAWTAEKYRRFDPERTDAARLAERSTNKFNPVIWNKPGSAPSDPGSRKMRKCP